MTTATRNGDAAQTLDEAIEQARDAGLRYIPDSRPGWSRQRNGKGFAYLDEDGKRITDPRRLERIEKLVIPPAWERVWICPSPTGHLQATGRDQKGRKVYRYHERWRAARDETKYGNLAAFAECLPKIRERVEKDLRERCMSREKVLAIVVELLQKTQIRIGNETYAKENEHFGLTTLRRRHLQIDGGTIRFEFVGKSGKARSVSLRDRRLANAIDRCCDIPGYELFKYQDDDGEKHVVESADVNAYLRETTGQDFTAKHFRTWAGTVIAAVTLCSLETPLEDKQREANIVTAIRTTAEYLGNTPATCRKFYIHPLIYEAYRDGSLLPAMQTGMAELGDDARAHRMEPEEAAVLSILKGARKR